MGGVMRHCTADVVSRRLYSSHPNKLTWLTWFKVWMTGRCVTMAIKAAGLSADCLNSGWE